MLVSWGIKSKFCRELQWVVPRTWEASWEAPLAGAIQLNHTDHQKQKERKSSWVAKMYPVCWMRPS